MELLRTPGRRHGLTTPVRVHRDGVGGPTKSQAAGPGWRRTSSGLYVRSDIEPSGLQRTLEAGVLTPRYGAVTGWAALAWLGARWSSGLERDGVTPRPVPIAQTRHWIRPQSGIRLCEERFDPREVVVVDGVAVTDAVRSVCFEMRYAHSLASAVTALDMAAYDDLVTIKEVEAWMRGHPSYTGIGQGRDAVPLGDENAWSPMEVLTRTAWVVDAGLPAPLTNRPVFDLHGRHLATPDLIDPAAGVVAEYDGRAHLARQRRRGDRNRYERYQHHHLECVVVMEGDLRDPWDVARRLRAAYARAEQHGADRTWTMKQPHWWTDTSTVQRRRALDEAERQTWLGYRSAA